MEIKSYDELMMCIYEDRGVLASLNLRLRELSVNPFSSDCYERREIKSDLSKMQRKLDIYKRIIDEATTFERDELLKFICEILRLTEEEEYVVTRLTEIDEIDEDDYDTGLVFFALGTALRNPELSLIDSIGSQDEETERKSYYFVSNKKVADVLHSVHENRIDNSLGEIEDAKSFYVTKKEVHLSHGTSLKRKYMVFPQLQEVFRRLVDLHLQRPELSDKERFQIIIEETKGHKFINKF